MCIASIGKIVKIDGDNAEADFGGIIRAVSRALKPAAKKGDYVLAHAGFIIEIIPPREAKKRLSELKETGLLP